MNIITLLLALLLVCLICGVIWWAISALGMPEPFARVAQVLVLLVFVVILVLILMQVLGVAVHLPMLK